ncbi:SDR family oxidoreductase [Shewanella intestini]|uniref:dTDP-4-dehydrorhamnose reductase n=1 Tax=Shewanella intestini TaxID=2017544 RepID=A0ABS5I0D4_9GAMM|nr:MULTISPECIES: sugar nucleotide-binding protein [Shewanella]MBR9727293.1 sugar nucleotide-binding protein [Shewanella intestini]MRG35657.1 sugar nucleotide-binding protein [Shewanella sp. XMDDZSB0408]
MKVLVIGGQSQLAQSLKARLIVDDGRLFAPAYQDNAPTYAINDNAIEFVFTNKAQLDITHAYNVQAAINDIKPHIIINCAALTDVEQAEQIDKQSDVFAVNADGVQTLSQQCKRNDILLIYLSTDYVFDGNTSRPYLSDDPCQPLNQYGLSKRQGELNAINSGCRYVVIRTSWLFSEFGQNFVKSMLRLGGFYHANALAKPLNIVNDQRGNPTYAGHLADALIAVVQKNARQSVPSAVYHFSDTVVSPAFLQQQQQQQQHKADLQTQSSSECEYMDVSWFEFAQSIFQFAEIERNSFIPPALTAVSTIDYVKAVGQQAKRPKYSSLNCDSFYETFGVVATDWRVGLKKVIKACAAEAKTG